MRRMTRAEVGPDEIVKCQYQFGPIGSAHPTDANSGTSPYVGTDPVSVRTRRARIKSFLIFSYIGCGKGTKNGTENPSGIPVYNGFTTRFARAYEKAN